MFINFVIITMKSNGIVDDSKKYYWKKVKEFLNVVGKGDNNGNKEKLS